AVVRKIERQYAEVAGSEADSLRAANEMTVENFLRNFQWDYARYRYQGRQLPDLVSQVQAMVAKVDDELKKLSISYNEKLQQLSAVQRKKTTNLITSDLEDFLPADTPSKFEFVNSEYLVTLLVVVPGPVEAGKSYEDIGADIAAYGGPDWSASFNPAGLGKDDGNFGPEGNRGRVRGSPVVPGSATKIFSEGESHLYSVTVLKGHYEAGYFEGSEFVPGKFVDYSDAVKNASREKRFTVREFVFDPSKAGGVDGQIDQAKWEVQQTLTTIVRWCRAHFGEVFSGWMHLKVVKGFVESVLRYGLPVDFLSVFVEPNMKREKQQLQTLKTGIFKMRTELAANDWEADGDDNKDGNDESDSLPFVFHRFNATA
ncbi:vha-11, partial [Symbiodinium microadriaticum]